MRYDDTIFGLSTPVGSGISIIRISGPLSEGVLLACFSRTDSAAAANAYEDRKLTYGFVFDKDERNDRIEQIDEALAVLFRGPRSYTGEDCAELQCHGSPAAVRRILHLLARLRINGQSLRAAEPGEFTRRAFVNGRLELSQAEAVMDLINASAQAGAKAALEQLGGSLGRAIRSLTDRLTDSIARIEAGIDYPEEDWENDGELVRGNLNACLSEISALLSTAAQGKLLREGIRIALAGRPNAGKSSLLNALLGERRAIVSAIPGTTRDLIEEQLDLGGLPVRIVDTAGLRETNDEIERIGVELTKEAMTHADLVLLVFDGAQPLTDEDFAVIELAKKHPRIAILTKSDLPQVVDAQTLAKLTGASVVTTAAPALGEPHGLDELKTAICAFFDSLAPREQASALVTNARHAEALSIARDALADALTALSTDLDCAAIDLRRALHALGEITGESVDEAVIDRIFSRFCLGK